MIRLSDIDSRPPKHADKDDYKDLTKEYTDRLGELQDKLYAQKKYGVLVIFQGMDASGKDGAVKNVFQECQPSGLRVTSFKRPTEEEFAHDFLWRIHQHAPPKGMIHIFNRSHYEDVLIQRVHKWVDEKTVDSRFDAINAFESLLQTHANTVVFKFYMHISYEQQAIELQERLDSRSKNWKHNEGDWKEREYWSEYMRCYEDAFNRSVLPWTIVPVDERWYRDYVISKTIVEKLEQLGLDYPPFQKVKKP
ncbi:MAG: polyphosphate kinase [Haliscomenobacter sp.]|nr:polyphosphate kinase [Haliscomenobacter sp.]